MQLVARYVGINSLVNEFNNIYPINSSVTLGKIDSRWNAGYFNVDTDTLRI